MSPPLPTPDPQTARIVVLGPPGAGKSSLLGALLQAARTQHELLRADVVDTSRRLEELRDRAYAGRTESTAPDAVPYPVRVKPWRGGRGDAGEPLSAVFVDTNGDRGVEMMTRSLPTGRRAAGELGRAVHDADCLLLVVNADATRAQLDDTFAAFRRFVDGVEHRRQFGREVGGLPVFLVLAQCDRLRETGDDAARWQGRIAARERQVLERFADHFADDDTANDTPGSPYLTFGSLELAVRSTAVRRPKLADRDEPSDEPVGVADLFRDCLAAARDHRRRERDARRRLKWTVSGVAAAVWALVAGMLLVLAFANPPGDPGLAGRVRAYMSREGSPAERLAAKALPPREAELRAVRADPRFDDLPAELREFVESRLKEFADYRTFRAKFAPPRPAPADARTLEDLAKTEAALRGELKPPPEYTWKDTEAGRLRAKWLADAAAIRGTEGWLHDWFRGLIRRETELVFAPTLDPGWRREADALLARAEAPPVKLADPLPNSPTLPGPRGAATTYAVPWEFDRVDAARRDWEYARDRLVRLRDLTAALGMTVDPGRPEAALALPEPAPEVDSAAVAANRLAALRQFYPRGDGGYASWAAREFPDPVRAEIDRRARRAFDVGVRHVRRLVRGKLGDPPAANDTPAGWRAVADALDAPAFRDWGVLLTTLAALYEPQPTDPVADLRAFLRRDRFEIDARGFELTVPDDLRADRVVPAGRLTLRLKPAGDAAPTALTFRPDGDPRRERLATVYRFVPEAAAKLTVRPGDGLTAELPVRAGGQEMRLEWANGRTATYQFDRLSAGPKLVSGPGGPPPERASGVLLTPTPGSLVPAVSDLIPEL